MCETGNIKRVRNAVSGCRGTKARLGREQAILAHAEIRKNFGALKRGPTPARGGGGRRPAADVAITKITAPAARFQFARQEVDERRLAGAVRPDDRVHEI